MYTKGEGLSNQIISKKIMTVEKASLGNIAFLCNGLYVGK